MIVWINGTFGVGKTTTAGLVSEQSGWRLFDPEHVGYLLAGNMRDLNFDDFQDLPPWRDLVPVVANAIYRYTSAPGMVAVQTVLVENYWDELKAGLSECGLPVFHVVLDCQEQELRHRIANDEVEHQAKDWRLDHIAKFQQARSWLARSADVVVDTTRMLPAAVAETVTEAARAALESG